MRAEPSLLWEEGMFLRPHHLQSLSRNLDYRFARARAASGPFRWGVSEIEIDEDGIGDHDFIVVHADLVTPRGIHIRIPETASVAARRFETAFDAAKGPVPVYLGVSVESASQGRGANGHFVAKDVDDVYDENTGSSPQALRYRIHNAQLFFGHENRAGYDCVQIAEIVRESALENQPILSPTFVPASLRIGAHPRLPRLIKEVRDELRAKNRQIASAVAQWPESRAARKEADALTKLQTTNTHVAVFDQLIAVDDMHPFDVYLSLCRLVGDVAVFNATTRGMPDVEPYDHERLGPHFGALASLAKQLLGFVYRTTYDVRPFEADAADPRRMHVDVRPEWLESKKWKLYIAVETSGSNPPSYEQIHDRITRDLKFAASTDVEDVVGMAVHGIRISALLDHQPHELPPPEGKRYYLVDRGETAPSRWERLRACERMTLVWTGDADPDYEFHLFAGMTES